MKKFLYPYLMDKFITMNSMLAFINVKSKIFDKDFADIYMDAIKEAKAYDDVAELTRITRSTFNGAAVAQMHHTMMETQLGYLGIIDTDKVQKTLERVEAIGKEIGEL